MSHVQPKEVVTVQYIGENPTKIRPFIGGEKVDVVKGDKIDMDVRQAATALIDHLSWKQVGAKRDGFTESAKDDDQEEKKTMKKKK